MLEELKRKGRQLKEAQAKGVFKKKQMPQVEEMETVEKKNIMIDSIDSESDGRLSQNKKSKKNLNVTVKTEIKMNRTKEKKITYKKKAGKMIDRSSVKIKKKGSSRTKDKLKKDHITYRTTQSKTSNNTRNDSKSATSNSNISNKISKAKRALIQPKASKKNKNDRGMERFSSVPKGEFLRLGSKIKDKRPRKPSSKKGKENPYRRSEAVSLKKFLEKKKSTRKLMKMTKGYQTEIRKSSMMKSKRRIDDSLRKYLPKGFKKTKANKSKYESKGYKKKKISDPREVKSKFDNSIPSEEDFIAKKSIKVKYELMKHKIKRGEGSTIKSGIKAPKSLRAMKFENLLANNIAIKKDSTYQSMSKAPKNSLLGPRSLPKINGSHKNFYRGSDKGNPGRIDFKPHFSKVANTEYDYLNSQRDTAGGNSGFDGSRLSHGSMISNNLRKKVAVPVRAGKSNINKKKKKSGMQISKKGKRVEYAMKPKKNQKKRQSKQGKGRGKVNGLPRGAFKAITAKKKKPRGEWKQAFSKDNPHLRTAPEMMRKSTPKSKMGLKNVINRHKKQMPFADSTHLISASIQKKKAKFLTNYSKNSQNNQMKRSEKQKGSRPELWVQVPGWYRGPPSQRVKTPREEDGLGIFDFSTKHNQDKIFDTGNSFEHMNRFFNPMNSRKNTTGKHFSSSSVNKKANKAYDGSKMMGRHSAINTQLTRFSTLEMNNPRGSKISRGSKASKTGTKYSQKWTANDKKSPKNRTIDGLGPASKLGKFKSKLLRNLTEKNSSSQRVLFEGGIGQKFSRANSKPSKLKSGGVGFESTEHHFRQKQNVYNHIRMGDSNVSNKFIINLGQTKGKNSPKGRFTRFWEDN